MRTIFVRMKICAQQIHKQALSDTGMHGNESESEGKQADLVDAPALAKQRSVNQQTNTLSGQLKQG
jgi:hypothetical protein